MATVTVQSAIARAHTALERGRDANKRMRNFQKLGGKP